VGDEYDGDSLAGDQPHDIQQAVCFAFGQHRGRFVENEQLDAGFVDLTGNLDELFIPDGHPRNLGIVFDVHHTDTVQGFSGFSGHLIPVHFVEQIAKNLAERGRFANLSSQFYVFRNGKFGDEHEFLVDHADSVVHGGMGRVDVGRLSVQQNLALKSTC